MMSKTSCLLFLTFIALIPSGLGAVQAPSARRGVSPLPPDQGPRFITQLGHSRIGNLYDAAFSSDGRLLLTGGDDNTAILWDLASEREIRRFNQSNAVLSLAFSPDGRLVLTGDSNGAHLWEAATGKELRRFASQVAVDALAFSPDGRFVFTSGLPQSHLWEAATGKQIRQFNTGEGVASVSFSQDGSFILTGCFGNTATLWDVGTGEAVRRFKHFDGTAKHLLAALSPDGRFVLTVAPAYGSRSTEVNFIVQLWDKATGESLHQFKHATPVRFAEFSPDSHFVLTSSLFGQHIPGINLHFWEVASGTEQRTFKQPDTISINLARFSPDGQSILINTYEHGLALLDSATGKEVSKLSSDKSAIKTVATSPDNRFFLTCTTFGDEAQVLDEVWYLWSAQGEPVRMFEGFTVSSASFSPDGRAILAGIGNAVALYHPDTGEVMSRFDCHSLVTHTEFSGDGRYVLAVTITLTAYLWDTVTGKEVWHFQYGIGKQFYPIAAVSPDGSLLVTSIGGKSASLWQGATGKEIRRFTGSSYVASAAFSPDGHFVITGNSGDTTMMWEVSTGREVARFTGEKADIWFIDQVEFSPDGRTILSRSSNGVRLWDARSKRQIQHFQNPAGITRAAYSRDGRFVLIGGWDFTVRLLNARSGREMCRMVTLRNGAWVVVDPEGRFDTNDFNRLETSRALHWIVPDDPFRPLPIEIFMRDYYEPRLLSRIVAGEQLRPVRSLVGLNRVQPKVIISKIEKQNNSDTVNITVEVSRAEAESKRGNKRLDESGVYDLRLFRDGQLVAYTPAEHGEVKLDAITGKAAIRFDNIQLPQSANLKEVEFSAYAFNIDRVKSATDKKRFNLPQGLSPSRGRAYVLTVGVNAYENPLWNLSFAAGDARQIEKVLSESLSKTGVYEEVVRIPLIADYRAADGKITQSSATKSNLKAVLDLLSGRQLDANLIKGIPNVEKLRPAKPEDLVIISYSSHGYADGAGNFYLFPYDTGAGWGRKISRQVLKRLISSEELSLWLRDVDAGELVMIVDACYSAAAIEGRGFKPGPMGSRGLGQLAYDKGMRVLAATQADDVALEEPNLRQGLLSYALIKDGLEARQADNRPADGIITLNEWLRYGVERVPALYQEAKTGQIQTPGRERRPLTIRISGTRGSLKKNHMLQQPALFDFAGKKPQVVIVKK
jgi:WD40 repeat protein